MTAAVTETVTSSGFWNWDLGVAAGVAGAIFAVVFFLQPYLLNSKGTRYHIIQLVEGGVWLSLYRSMVNGILSGLQKVFGNAGSLQAFSFCFILALAYPTIFFIFAYSWGGGTHEFAGQAMFDSDSVYRTWYFPAIIVFVATILYVFKNTDRIDSFCENYTSKCFDSELWGERFYQFFCALLAAALFATYSQSIWVIGLLLYVGYSHKSLAVAFAGASAALIAIAVAVTLSGAILFAGAVTIAIVLVLVSASAVVGAVAGAFAIAVLFYYQESYTASLSFVLLFMALPFFNAGLDWLSWWFSRWFLQRAAQEDNVLMIVRDIFLDFLLAIIFMILLCLILSIGIEWVNTIYAPYDADAVFDWRTLAMDAKTDPWGKGLMVSLMIVTTLIPTFLHILLALVAVVMQSFLGRPFVNQLKAYEGNESNLHLLAASGWLMLYVMGVTLGMWALYHFVMLLFHIDIAGWLYQLSMWGVALVGLG